MRILLTKQVLIAAVALALILVIALIVLLTREEEPVPEVIEEVEEIVEVRDPRRNSIGASVEGREIESYTFGEGENHLAFVGGIHGGYEWNSVILAYRMIDHFEANPESIPENIKMTIIPSANPDGVFDVIGVEGRFGVADVPANTGPVGTGRFNANNVDLNRNFDCKWQPESSWRGNTVSAGTEAFSEPEAQALRDFSFEHEPDVVVFWHSQANAVYASECEEGVLPATLDVMNAYASAAGYNAVPSFDAYPVTGDAEGWLASIGIPAVTVELKTHETVEFDQNLRGVEALLALYGEAN